jgi:thioesterase domain-containing protein
LSDSSPIVLLKAGGNRPPVFLAHGLGGRLDEFSQLVSYIQSDHPIYGLEAKGTDGLETPLDRIENMAQYYLESLKEVQPRGPYFFVGHSLGGLIVLEMAQRLSAEREKVALLAMLDCYPHMRYLSVGQIARLLARRVARHAARVARLRVPQAFAYIFLPSSRARILSKNDRGSSYAGAQEEMILSPAMQQLRKSDSLALRRYRPHFYRGKVKFVKAEIASEFPTNPVAIWSGRIEKLEVEIVPGDHQEILTTHFGNVADLLSRYLQEADSSL